MKKLAIISSYNELCGNATYTHALKREFEAHYDVEVIGLKTRLLGMTRRKMVRMGDAMIAEIAARLKDFDYVNIQFESILYGGDPASSVRRAKKLIDAAPNLIFTMHRVEVSGMSLARRLFKHRAHGLVTGLLEYYRGNIHAKLTARIVRHLKAQSKKKNVWLMVHTKWDNEMVRSMFDWNHVLDYPLTFLHPQEIQAYRHSADPDGFKARYGLPPDAKTIGVFGFLNEYKGFETAIDALRYLPNDYHVMVFGGQHPLTIREMVPVDPYIKQLIHRAKATPQQSRGYPKGRLPIVRRVHFVGNVNDDDFINALICCDRVILPYLEVGQSMSGVASLVLETRSRSLFARNRATLELQRYAPGCFETFDIGNQLELARKVLAYQWRHSEAIDRYATRYNLVNNILLHKSLFENGAPPTEAGTAPRGEAAGDAGERTVAKGRVTAGQGAETA